MKSKKGMHLIWDIIIIAVFAIVILSLGTAGLLGWFNPIYQTGINYTKQASVAAKITPQSWYNVEITDAVKGEINFTVQNTNGTTNTIDDVYVTDFDPTVGYKVYDNKSQTTVLNVKEYPVAYIAVVADPSSQKFDDAFWSNLTKIKFAEANIAAISVIPPILEKADFANLNRPAGTGSADYWGALAAAGNSLPTVQAKRNLGPNFLAIILVSEGRNDVISDKDTEKIASALLLPQDTHFYMLRSSCDIPLTNGTDVQKDISNATLEGYKAATSVSRADCYTNASALFDDLLVKDLAPIIMEYEPVKPAIYAGDMKLHNITVEVTKRTGVLGTEAAYSGKGSTPPGIMQKY